MNTKPHETFKDQSPWPLQGNKTSDKSSRQQAGEGLNPKIPEAQFRQTSFAFGGNWKSDGRDGFVTKAGADFGGKVRRSVAGVARGAAGGYYMILSGILGRIV